MARVMLARARARFGVLAGVATMAFLLTAFLAVVLGILVSAPTAAARDAVVAADGADGAARWHTRLGDDATAQADAAARVLDRFVTPHAATWERSVQTAPVATLGDDPIRLVLLADPEAPSRAELVDGAWPDDADAADAAAAADARPAAVHAGAASAARLEIGSVVELDGARLLVVGLWAPVDPADPAWAGDPLASSGVVDDAAGPVLVDEAALADVEGATTVRWTVVADAATAEPESLAALRAAFPSITPALANEPDLGTDGIIESGGLGQSLDRLVAGLGAVRALAPLPLLLLGVAGLVALVRLAALLAAERRRETTLLLARGASATSVARHAAVESLAVAAPAAAAGALAGGIALAVAAPLASTRPALTWLVGGGVLLLVVGILTATAWAEARRPVVRGSGDETGRARRVFAAGGVIVLAALAAIALWQFRLYGSPLVPSANGPTRVDPLAALAPVLVLLALAVAAVAVAGGAGRLLERWGATRPGLVPALPARQLARRTPLYASAVLVLSFAAGGLALTAAVDGSWRAFDADAAAAEIGGDVRVTLPGRSVVADDAPSAGFDVASGRPTGGTAAIPVFRGEVRVGSDPAGLVALPPERLPDAAPGAGTPLPADVASALASTDRGPAVAPGAEVVVDAEVRDAASAVPETGAGSARAALSVWLLDADGVAHRIPAGEAAAGGEPVFAARAPELDGLTLLGVEARSEAGGEFVVTVEDVIVEPSGSTGVSGETTVSSTSPTGRIAVVPPDAPVSVVVDRRLAALTDAGPGDPIEFRIQTGGAIVRAEVAAVVPVVAGAEPAIIADLAAISARAFATGAGVPQHTEFWIASDAPESTASALLDDRSAALDVDTRADASSTAVVAPALTALWIGAAGAAGFALVALAGLVAALTGARSGEVAVLRALGTPARSQAAARRTELLGIALTATAIGVAIGLAVALLTAPELGRAAVPGAATGLAVAFAPSWLPFALGIAALAAGGAAVSVAAARAVRVRALTAVPGGEDR